jgi:putative membrane protein
VSDEGHSWRWLHPASIVVNLLPRSVRVLRNLWPLFFAFLWNGAGTSDALLWTRVMDASIIGMFFAATVGGTLMHFLTLRYRVHDGRLEIRTGLLNRKIRTIDPARIQNIELVRSISHKLSGLVEIRIETASGKEVEGLLSALSETQALQLQRKLEALRAAGPAQQVDDDAPPLVRNGIIELFIYSATAARLGAVAVALGLVFEGYTWLYPDQMSRLPGQATGIQGLAMLILLFTGTWLAGLVTTTLRHWGFALHLVGDRLVVEGGLTTRRRLELPLSKVQVVHTSQTLLRRWAGFSTLTVQTAAARSGQGGTERTAAMVPYLPATRMAELTAIAVPDLDLDPFTAQLKPPHRLALARTMARATVQWIIITGLAVALVGPWAIAVGVVGVALPIATWLDWRHQGWRITEHTVVARRGFWNRRITVLSRSKLQSASARDNPLLRRLGLGQVVLHAAGTTVHLPLMSWSEARDIGSMLARSAGRSLSLSPPSSGDPQHGEGGRERHDEPDHGRQQDQTHDDRDGHHHPVAPGLIEQRPDRGNGLGDDDNQGHHTAHDHGAGEQAGLAVEAQLPDLVEPPLAQQEQPHDPHEDGEE